MTKAVKVREIDCQTDAIERITEVLRLRFEEMAGLRGVALDFSNIEGVHDMRVAARRLRSALRDFSPFLKKNLWKNVRRELKRIADALGAVRDEDVALAALEKLQAQAETEEIRAEIEEFGKNRRQKREQARLDLIEALAVAHFSPLQDEISAVLEESLRGKNALRNLSFNEAGNIAVNGSLDEFCDLSDALYQPCEINKLHKLRISAKRLRYAVELFTACWGEKIAPFAQEIAEMQSALGDVHDCDVWIENLGEKLQKQKHHAQSDLWLLSEFSKKRTKNYLKALKLWNKWNAENLLESLLGIITDNYFPLTEIPNSVHFRTELN